jgi:hypothetical protein
MAYGPGILNEILDFPYFATDKQNDLILMYESLVISSQSGGEIPYYSRSRYETSWVSMNTKYNGKIKLINTNLEGPGYRIDVNDERDIFSVGDIVSINDKQYKIAEIVTPEFTPKTGKILSPQNISDTPIEVFPSTKRTYRFDISININEI